MRKNKDKAVASRRAAIARLYLEGYTGQEIAPRVGVSESQVSRDLKIINSAWRETAVLDIGERKAQDLAELALIRRELWEAWTTSKSRKADSRYLTEVLKALKQAAELLGYHAGTKLRIDYENMSEKALDSIINQILQANENNIEKPED